MTRCPRQHCPDRTRAADRRSTGSGSPISCMLSRALDALEEKTSRSRRARFSTSSPRAATTWRRSCLGLQLTHPQRRDLRLLPFAAGAAGARRRSGGCARLVHGARRRLFRRARYRRGVQLSQRRRRLGAADVRRRRRAIHADGRLGAGARIPRDGAEGDGLRRRHRAWRSAATPRSRPTASGRR